MPPESDLIDPFDPNDVRKAESTRDAQVEKAEADAATVLKTRREAYSRLFNGGATAYDVRTVLDDLRRFCRIRSSTFDPDPRIHALLEGRREVMQRIEDHILLDFETLYRKYTEQPNAVE